MTDKLKALEAYSDDELLGEIQRRRKEAQQRLSRLSLATGVEPGKNPLMSEAKAAYWAAWHEYKAAHPDATVGEWRKAAKTRKGKG